MVPRFVWPLRLLALPLVLILLLTYHPTVSSIPSRHPSTPALVRRKAPDQPPLAITMFWFNNQQKAICYDLTARVKSVTGYTDCDFQDDYDSANNSYFLPQTCVLIAPLSEALFNILSEACRKVGTLGEMDVKGNTPSTPITPGNPGLGGMPGTNPYAQSGNPGLGGLPGYNPGVQPSSGM
nr:putative essential during penetration 1 protein [Thecaphora frezii]